MTNQTLTVVAKIEAKTLFREKVKKELFELISSTLAENGCINYDLHQDHTDKNVFLFYENWESHLLWLEHNDSEHIAKYQKATKGCIESFEIFEMSKLE